MLNKFFLTFLIIQTSGYSVLGQARVQITFSDLTDVELPIYINVPMESGNFCNYHHVAVRPDKDNNIQLNIPLERPGFLSFSIVRKKSKPKSVHVYLESQQRIFVKIDSKNQLHFEGRLREENNFLNSLDRDEFPHSIGIPSALVKTLLELENAQLMIDTLKQREQIDLSRLKSAVTSSPKSFSETFINMVEMDIKYYYLVVGAASMEKRYSNFLYAREQNAGLMSKEFSDPFQSFWDSLFKKENFATGAFYTFWFHYFIYDYAMLYKTFFLRENYDVNTSFNFLREGLSNGNTFLHDEIKESFLAFTFLLFFQGTTYHNDGILNYYHTLQSEFPDSKYLSVVRPKAIEIEKTLDDLSGQQILGINFISNTDKIRDLSQTLSIFKDKVVLIDLWASWCGPCLFEYENNYTELWKLQESHSDFIILYISLDRNDAPWKKMIYAKKLFGYHIRPDENLFNKLKSEINWQGIPRYVVVDKLGNVIQNPAPGPGDGDKLIDLLRKELSSN